MPSRRTPPRPFPVDAIVYLATVAAGSALILIGHLSPQDLAGYATALTSLYAAWRHHQPAHPPRPTRHRAPTGRNRGNIRPAGGEAAQTTRGNDGEAGVGTLDGPG